MRYALDDKVPDHSALTRIRDRLGEDLFKEVFERVVLQGKKAGLVKGKQMVTDATLIEADAALESVAKRDDVNSKDVPETVKGEEFEGKNVSIRTHESSTDPDASVVSCSGKKTSSLL